MNGPAWPASARYASANQAAPGDLGFVEDLLNTASLGKPKQQDLLASIDMAQDWLNSSLSVLAEVGDAPAFDPAMLEGDGLKRLIEFREHLRTALVRDEVGSPTKKARLESTVSVRFDTESVTLGVRGAGIEALRSYCMLQLAAAAYSGTLDRLKVCENPRCRGAFYDRSKNRSRAWHDVATCGNTANLRAYRARRRDRQHSSAGELATHETLRSSAGL